MKNFDSANKCKGIGCSFMTLPCFISPAPPCASDRQRPASNKHAKGPAGPKRRVRIFST